MIAMGLPVLDSTADSLGQPKVSAGTSGGEGMLLLTHSLEMHELEQTDKPLRLQTKPQVGGLMVLFHDDLLGPAVFGSK